MSVTVTYEAGEEPDTFSLLAEGDAPAGFDWTAAFSSTVALLDELYGGEGGSITICCAPVALAIDHDLELEDD